MFKLKRKIFSILLISSMVFSGCSLNSSNPPPKEPKESPVIEKPSEPVIPEKSKLALVPLDDRPANTYFVEKIAKSANLEVVLPPSELLGNFTTPGKGDKIAEWLSTSGGDVDGFVVSLTMLASGGLVSSRTGTPTVENAEKNLNTLRILKNKYPDKPIYAFDTIQRLTITSTGSQDLENYENIRQYSILFDKVNNLKMTELKGQLDTLLTKIPKDVLADYLKARTRNQVVNKTGITLTEEGIIDHLIIGQDDSHEYGIHRSERDELKKMVNDLGLSNKVYIFPGADQLGALLVAKFANTHYGKSPIFYSEYTNKPENNWVAMYDDIPFVDQLKIQVESIGGKMTSNIDEANIILMINNGDEKAPNRATEVNAFVNQIKHYISQNKTISVLDINNGDRLFTEKLLKEVEITKLISYSSWNASNNVVGIGVSHAAARHAFINTKTPGDEMILLEPAKHHVEFLLSRFSKDYLYREVIKDELQSFVEQNQVDRWNLRDKTEIIMTFLNEHLTKEINTIFKLNFMNKNIVVGQNEAGQITKTISELKNVEITVPWNRLFEIGLYPSVDLK